MEIALKIQATVIHITLTLGIMVSLRSFYGFFSGSTHKLADKVFAGTFMVSLYIQLIMIAYVFLSFSFNYEESIKVTENAALSLFAALLAQGGRLIVLKANDNSVKFRFRSIFYGLATGLLIYAYLLTFQIR